MLVFLRFSPFMDRHFKKSEKSVLKELKKFKINKQEVDHVRIPLKSNLFIPGNLRKTGKGLKKKKNGSVFYNFI